MRIEGLLNALPAETSPTDRELVQRAYRVAEKAHRRQKRASGEPYINHCIAVALILVDLGAPVPAVALFIIFKALSSSGIASRYCGRYQCRA